MPKQQTKLSPEKFLELVNQHKKVVLAFDYDGTLTKLVKDHDGAILTDQETELLNKLAKLPDTTVSIVTGRAIANLKKLLKGRIADTITLYGTHGAEKNESSTDTSHRDHLNAIKQLYSNEPHIHFEEKPLSITIHYKEHPNREELKTRLLKTAENYQKVFRVQQGHDVFEFLPKEINKGLAIADLNKNHTDSLIVFLGDDLTDNFGFKVVNELNGVSIQVSDRVKDKEAGYLIDSVEDTYKLIHAYLDGRKVI